MKSYLVFISLIATFALLAITCVLQIGLVWRWLPEIKRKSIEEIEKLWEYA